MHSQCSVVAHLYLWRQMVCGRLSFSAIVSVTCAVGMQNHALLFRSVVRVASANIHECATRTKWIAAHRPELNYEMKHAHFIHNFSLFSQYSNRIQQFLFLLALPTWCSRSCSIVHVFIWYYFRYILIFQCTRLRTTLNQTQGNYEKHFSLNK